MRVLYVNHTALMSGGELSLVTLLEGLPDEVSAAVASPAGPLAERVAALGLPVHGLPGTAGSLKLHPLHTPRALLQMGGAALSVRRTARAVGADLVHANSIRAGLVCVAARRIGGPPVVVHVRDCLPRGRVTSATKRAIGAGADLMLFNSRYTQERFAGPDSKVPLRVAYSPVDLARFDPASVDRDEARRALGLEESEVALVVVAQITPWKAQDDVIRALGRLRERHAEARLLLVGSAKFVSGATRFDNNAFVRQLNGLIAENGLGKAVRFLGERNDIPHVLRAADVVVLPSWEEPFGRSLVEAMAMGVPVVATNVGGPREIVEQGVEGLLVPPRDPARLAEALGSLLKQPELRARMGQAGRIRARERFSAQHHVDTVLDAYRAVTSST